MFNEFDALEVRVAFDAKRAIIRTNAVAKTNWSRCLRNVRLFYHNICVRSDDRYRTPLSVSFLMNKRGRN